MQVSTPRLHSSISGGVGCGGGGGGGITSAVDCSKETVQTVAICNYIRTFISPNIIARLGGQ